MVSKKVTISNMVGLHIGPAGKLCDIAVGYESHIVFKYRDYGEANMKSMLSVLGAGIRSGEEIEIICDGPDEEEALNKIVALIESNFE